jgi:hypothetical protein
MRALDLWQHIQMRALDLWQHIQMRALDLWLRHRVLHAACSREVE